MLALEFMSPGRLWFLIVPVLMLGLYIAASFRNRSAAIRFSNVNLLDRIAPRRPRWRKHVIAAIHLSALVVGVVGYARPFGEDEVLKEQSTVILAIDTSISMESTDVDPSRLDAAKAAAIEFVESVPPGLKLGLVSFNENVVVNVRPTDDHTDVKNEIEFLRLDYGTSIGDAVIASLETIGLTDEEGGSETPGTIVLLSDGETTVGTPTLDAVAPAVAAGVPVTTIAFGTANGTIEIDENGDGVDDTVSVPVAPQPLKDLAEGTGGRAFEADSVKDLSDIYSELGGKFETELETVEFTERFLAAAMALVVTSSLLSLLWFQRIP